MSNKSSILLRTLGVILLIVIILGGGAAAFMAGQSRGYMLGANAVGSPSTAIEPGAAPTYPYYYPHMGMGRGYGFFPFMPFMGFGGLIGLLFMGLFVLFLLRLIFFPYRWRHMNGEFHGRHWHGHPCWDGPWGEEPPAEKSDKPADEAKV